MASVATARAGAAPRMGKQARREELWFYLSLSPWLAGFVIFIAGPILASIYLAFTRYDPATGPPTWIGMANYGSLIHVFLFWQSLKVTLTYTAVSVPLSVAAATVVALLLNQGLPLLSMWRTIYYLPAVTSAVAVALMWQWIFQTNFGLLNGTLYSLTGLQGPAWLTDEHWVMSAMIIVSLWQFGGPMLIYLAAIQGVPTTLYESAEIDGASVVHIIGSLQVFTNAYVITRGGPHYATYFFVLNLYSNAFGPMSDLGYADALACVLFAIVLGVTFLAFKSARFWVFYESPGDPATK